MKNLETQSTPSHPQAIDLGLPSGTKWASCNIGATRPEEYGGYYAWGEIQEKELYERNSYAFYDKLNKSFTTPSENICGTKYDVARNLLGEKWQLPTIEQIKELVNCCSYEWTTLNGISGGKFIGPNGNSIFLPASGRHCGANLCDSERIGLYWSGTKSPTFNDGAHGLEFSETEASYHNYCDNYLGHSVRPVAAS